MYILSLVKITEHNFVINTIHKSTTQYYLSARFSGTEARPAPKRPHYVRYGIANKRLVHRVTNLSI